MSGTGNNTSEDTSVDPPTSTANGDTHTVTHRRTDSKWVTTPVDIESLSYTLSKALVEDWQSRAHSGSISYEVGELEDLDYEPHRRYYCIQLDVALTEIDGWPPPVHFWTPAIIHDIIVEEVPNVRDCVSIGLGLSTLFFGRWLELKEGLYLHEAQKLAELTRPMTWVGQPAMQQAFPVIIAEGRQAISMCQEIDVHNTENNRWMQQSFCHAHLWRGFEVIITDNGTKEDDDTFGSSSTFWPSGIRRRWSRINWSTWEPIINSHSPAYQSNPFSPTPELPIPPLLGPAALGIIPPPPPYISPLPVASVGQAQPSTTVLLAIPLATKLSRHLLQPHLQW